MSQEKIWEKEYQSPQLITKSNKPQKDLKRVLKMLRKDYDFSLEGKSVLDLGCGVGKNSILCKENGAEVHGLDISETAVFEARRRAKEKGLSIEYQRGDMGSPFPFKEGVFDLILDVVSSNSLNEEERDMYLRESARVLKSGGFMFVKALCKDGDKHAKNLLKKFPVKEHNTYLNPDLGLKEHVFTELGFRDFYEKDFTVLYLQKKTSYTRFKSQSYKRNFFVALLRKKTT